MPPSVTDRNIHMCDALYGKRTRVTHELEGKENMSSLNVIGRRYD